MLRKWIGAAALSGSAVVALTAFALPAGHAGHDAAPSGTASAQDTAAVQLTAAPRPADSGWQRAGKL